VCVYLYVCVYSTMKDGGSLCDLLCSTQNIEQEREGKRKERERKEKLKIESSHRRRHSSLYTSLIT